MCNVNVVNRIGCFALFFLREDWGPWLRPWNGDVSRLVEKFYH